MGMGQAAVASSGTGELRRAHTLCRACHLSCSLIVEFDGARPVRIAGDRDNPISHGFSCIRGRELANYAALPSRLTSSLARDGAGGFRRIASTEAARAIADQLRAIIDRHGPRAVAVYAGTYCVLNTLTNTFVAALMAAMGSPMYFTPEPIDQPGKPIANALHGRWLGGTLRGTDGFDVMLLIGSNPLVSGGGPFGTSPAVNLRHAKQQGTKLIVCDPRRTETARRADIHLQARPGEDPSVLAGLIRIILSERLYDQEFVAAEAAGLDALRAAVEPFDVPRVAQHADVRAEDLVATARAYAGARRGLVHVGTGPNMSGHSTLTEYLGRVLTTLCGHWPRAGERVSNPGVLVNFGDAIAATPGPTPATGFGEPLRVHGLSCSAAGMPTAVLPDEILMPGEGQVRALLVIGGNPMVAFPDQEKTLAAMQALELLVCVDPHLSATARLAHYVVAPTLPLETAGVCGFWEQAIAAGTIYGFDLPYQQYTPAILPPPPGADVVDEWSFLFDVAQHMGLTLTLKSGASILAGPEEAARTSTTLDMARKPTTDEAWALCFRGSPVPFEDVRRLARAGHVFEVPEKRIAPKPPGWQGRFDLGNALMMAQLNVLAARSADAPGGHPFRLISRRLKDVFNSNWLEHEPLLRKWRYNPAFMNPADMAELGLCAGQTIRIRSDRAAILALVQPEQEVRRGCISMSHGWGVNPGEPENPQAFGGTTSRLSDNVTRCDPISWIPIMSAIPVSIERLCG